MGSRSEDGNFRGCGIVGIVKNVFLLPYIVGVNICNGFRTVSGGKSVAMQVECGTFGLCNMYISEV